MAGARYRYGSTTRKKLLLFTNNILLLWNKKEQNRTLNVWFKTRHLLSPALSSLSVNIPLDRVYHRICHFTILFLFFLYIFCAFSLLNCYFFNVFINFFNLMHNPSIFYLSVQSICTNHIFQPFSPIFLLFSGCPGHGKIRYFSNTQEAALCFIFLLFAPNLFVSSPDNEPARLFFGRFARIGLSHHR